MIVRPTFPSRMLLALFLVACGSEEEDARVIVGLTTDMAVGFDIHEIERTTKVDGVVTHAERLSYGAGELSLPAELPIVARDGAAIEVSLVAFRKGELSPIVTRLAEARAQGGRTLFLPVSLDEACAGVSCAGPTTCVAGACIDPFLAQGTLEDHDPAWITTAEDACKTRSSGEPTVEIGQGKDAFAPLAEGEVVPIEPGPQGGHHIWLALRVTGLRQMGSRLRVGGLFPDLAYEVPPFTSQVTLRKAGDPCELYGVRFQVDRGVPVEAIRGLPLDVELVLSDPNDDAAAATTRVVIAP